MRFFKARCSGCNRKFNTKDLSLNGDLEWVCHDCLDGKLPEVKR